jgi:hypothetical protein
MKKIKLQVLLLISAIATLSAVVKAQAKEPVLITKGFRLNFTKPFVLVNASNSSQEVNTQIHKSSKFRTEKVSINNNDLLTAIEGVKQVSASVKVKETRICTVFAQVEPRTRMLIGQNPKVEYLVSWKSASTYTFKRAKEHDSYRQFMIRCSIKSEVIDMQIKKISPDTSKTKRQVRAKIRGLFDRKQYLNLYDNNIKQLIGAKLVEPVDPPMRTEKIGYDSEDGFVNELDMSPEELRMEEEFQKSLNI